MQLLATLLLVQLPAYFVESLEAVGNVLGATAHIHKTNPHCSLSYREPELGQTHQTNNNPSDLRRERRD
jgi:hypothetical protein